MRLWRHRLAAPSDIAPCTGTVLEISRLALDRVKPFQQEVVKLEWLLDFDYEGLSIQARELLKMLGYLPGSEVARVLRDALKLTDPYLKCCAAVSLLRHGEPVSPEEIEVVADSHLVRITLWENLQELGMESLMPLRRTSAEALAASALSRWLSHGNEMGAPPEEIELMKTIPIEAEGDLFLFRFRAYPQPWKPGGGWKAGIAGPYRNGKALDSPWSSLSGWDSMTPEKHFEMLYYRGEKKGLA
jgi:hypothetical protein